MDNEYIDPRVVKTREALLQAFNELLQEKTYKKITVQEITERARVNRATFYAHFYNKEELAKYGIQYMFEEQLKDWLPETPELTYENLNCLTLGVFKFLGEFLGSCHPGEAGHPPVFPLLHTQVQPQLKAIMKEWLAEKYGDDELLLETKAEVFSWSIFGSALQWANLRDAPPAAEKVDAVVAALWPDPQLETAAP